MLNINNIQNKNYNNPYGKIKAVKDIQTNKNLSFCGTKEDNKILKNNKNTKSYWKNFFPYVLSGFLTLSSSCQSNKGLSNVENFNQTKVEYFNVKKETKDSLDVTLKTLKSKLNSDNDFLKDVDVVITKTYDDMDDSHSFKRFLKSQNDTELDKGISFYSDKKIKRIIIVQEKSHDNEADKSLNEAMGLGYTAMPTLRHSLMHEIGHQFDEYFGHDHDSELAKQWDNIVYSKEIDSKQNPYSFDTTDGELDVQVDYEYSSGLSDKPEFQQALQKDLVHIAKLRKNKSSHLACNLNYYTQGIDFNKPITKQAVDLADYARSEVYANLFAYAMGENDGDKRDFTENFKNAYKVVQNNIQQYINVTAK